MTASGTAAILVKGTGIAGVLFIAQVHFAVPGKQIAVTGITAGHYAVKEVNTHVNRLKNIAGSTDTHQVSGLVFGHVRLNRIDYAVHLLRLLAHSQTTDSITLKVKLGNGVHMFDSQVLVNAALIDAE